MNIRSIRLASASAELLFAASLWGFGFVATVWALRSWDAVQMTMIRFLIGAAVGLAVTVWQRPSRSEWVSLLRMAFWPALLLTSMLLLQTWGLLYTTATKSAFITTLYIVLVPCFETALRRKPLPWTMWAFVAMSIFGILLIVNPSWGDGWNKGDFLTLLCAAAAAVQILAVDRVSGKVEKAFLFNSLMSFWGCWMTLPFLLLSHATLLPSQPPTVQAWLGIFSLSVGSTVIAFYLQIKAQKVLSPTVSSLFFLLESPFALVFAFLLLQERLNGRQGLGAVLLLASALLATLRESQQKKTLLASP